MKKHAKTILFLKLHPLNFPIAFFASFFCDIFYWKYEKLPEKWLSRFKVLDLADYFGNDEWQMICQGIYEPWCAIAKLWQDTKLLQCKLFDVEINFKDSWLQWLAIWFDEHCKFLCIAEACAQKYAPSSHFYIASTAILNWTGQYKFVFRDCGIPRLKWFAWLDRLWLACQIFMQWLHQLVLLFVSEKGSVGVILDSQVRYFYTAISNAEVAEQKDKLDFAFLVWNALLKPEECLYFLQKKPTQAAINRLAEGRIRWTTFRGITALLSFREKIALFFELLRLPVKVWSSQPCAWNRASFLHYQASKALCWMSLTQHFKPKVYLSNASACWPEEPAVCVMNAMKVRSVTWFYSSNFFYYTTNRPHFIDRTPRHSVWVSKEVWVWDSMVKDLLERRIVLPKLNQTSFELIGPVMCGRSAFLNEPVVNLRRKYISKNKQTSKFIAIFDVPSLTQKARCQGGYGPNIYSADAMNMFFEDVYDILQKFPNVSILFKPKKSLKDFNLREYPAAMWKLLRSEEFKDRVIQLDYDVDPYLPIAMADLCIGLPFTSPILVALHAKKTAWFYDPLGIFKYFHPKILKPLIITEKIKLFDCLRNWLLNGICFESQLSDELKSALILNEDPAIRFMNLLHRPVSKENFHRSQQFNYVR